MSLIVCPCLPASDASRQLSDNIDKEINQWMKQYKRSIKLLLLGEYRGRDCEHDSHSLITDVGFRCW